MRRAPARERFAAHFGDAPGEAELIERRGIGRAVEQCEIAEIAGDRSARPRHAPPGKLDRGHCAARGKAHLHRQLRGAFAMRLHRAGALSIIGPNGVAQLFRVKSGQHRKANRRAKS